MIAKECTAADNLRVLVDCSRCGKYACTLALAEAAQPVDGIRVLVDEWRCPACNEKIDQPCSLKVDQRIDHK